MLSNVTCFLDDEVVGMVQSCIDFRGVPDTRCNTQTMKSQLGQSKFGHHSLSFELQFAQLDNANRNNSFATTRS